MDVSRLTVRWVDFGGRGLGVVVIVRLARGVIVICVLVCLFSLFGRRFVFVVRVDVSGLTVRWIYVAGRSFGVVMLVRVRIVIVGVVIMRFALGVIVSFMIVVRGLRCFLRLSCLDFFKRLGVIVEPVEAFDIDEQRPIVGRAG